MRNQNLLKKKPTVGGLFCKKMLYSLHIKERCSVKVNVLETVKTGQAIWSAVEDLQSSNKVS